jgi:hypothetical protein
LSCDEGRQLLEKLVNKEGGEREKKNRQYKQWHHTWTCGRTNLNTHRHLWVLDDQRESNRVQRRECGHLPKSIMAIEDWLIFSLLFTWPYYMYVCVCRMRNIIMRLLVKVAVTRRQNNLSHYWKWSMAAALIVSTWSVTELSKKKKEEKRRKISWAYSI